MIAVKTFTSQYTGRGAWEGLLLCMSSMAK